ncbi:MAG: hypothetical protein AAGF96_05075 [Bacteroidota bacterium]
MDKEKLEEYIRKLQQEAPEIINEVYEALDYNDIEITRDALRERTGFDMDGMATRDDALLAVLILKAISGIQLTGEEVDTKDRVLAFREAQIKAGNWNPGFRWNGYGFSFDEDEPYLY